MLTYLFPLITSLASIACYYTEGVFNSSYHSYQRFDMQARQKGQFDPLASFECLSKQRNIGRHIDHKLITFNATLCT